MELAIDNRQDIIKIDDEIREKLNRAVEKCLEYEGWDMDYEVSLSLVNNNEIQELNRTYRGKDCVTDVLSFPMIDEDMLVCGEKLLGDIVISIEKAIDQAEDYGHSFDREIVFLTVHSMFHLMGYDHLEKEDEKIMRIKEEAVLSKLGLKRV